MTCCGLLREQLLALEAGRYGAAAGIRQQVIWPNGVLASTAVGLVVRLLTPWSPQAVGPILLEYDGNRRTLIESTRLEALRDHPCFHFSAYDDIGDPLLTVTPKSELRTLPLDERPDGLRVDATYGAPSPGPGGLEKVGIGWPTQKLPGKWMRAKVAESVGTRR